MAENNKCGTIEMPSALRDRLDVYVDCRLNVVRDDACSRSPAFIAHPLSRQHTKVTML